MNAGTWLDSLQRVVAACIGSVQRNLSSDSYVYEASLANGREMMGVLCVVVMKITSLDTGVYCPLLKFVTS
jgi:hypothetical protein